jgi:RNA polymerase sigma-70 factor (ECF subfamily)
MTADELLATLHEQRPAFLRFVQRKVQSEAFAEDIVQDALLRSLDHAGSVEAEGAVRWFYAVLENAIVDHFRRSATARKGLGQLATELSDAASTPDDAPARACKCVGKLKAELKAEQARALERIEVDEVPVKDFAVEAGISSSNAAVRVFRAREALRKKVIATCGHCAEAGCLDCSCAH